MPIYALNDQPIFPDPEHADVDGLLALGGDLSPRRVLTAYASGIFPWPIAGAPLAWFSPNPRMLLDFDNLRVSRSLRKTLARGQLRVTFDTAFPDVIAACSKSPRRGQTSTWVTATMVDAYVRLHQLGFAHSAETWLDDELVGGLYGVSIGGMFCGESMFHRVSDASKVAFVALARQLEAWEFDFLDCQLHTPHLESLGAKTSPRSEFLTRLQATIRRPTRRGSWTAEPFVFREWGGDVQ